MSLHPKIIDLTLGRVHRLLAALDHPERKLPPVIHIAGTNGKGSTQAMIRAGLEATGHRVQAYTSPHLARFHERIRLGDGLIAEDHLAGVLEECERANGDAPITYFEITTVAALLAFSRDDADFCLLEVGLGGRLDATNVIDRPRLTVITPVAMDHEQYLGDTLGAIAREKAGILKPGVAAIVGQQEMDAEDVITGRAAALGAPVVMANQDWQVWEEHGRLAFQDGQGLLDLPLPALIGAHQVANAGMALAVLRVLGVSEEAAASAMRDVRWAARMQRLTKGPLTDRVHDLWLDGGHNPAAGKALAEALSRLPKRPLHLICGMLNTKDVAGYMAPLAGLADGLTAVPIPDAPATLSAAETAAAAQSVGITTREAETVAAAADAILKETPEARILICGSLYLAGEVLKTHG